MLSADLQAIETLQRQMGFAIDGYFRRLDLLVAKYQDGISAAIRPLPRQIAVIPNGVPEVPAGQALDPGMLAAGADPDYALVTTCRLEAEKRLDYLVAMMRALKTRQPRASLTIVGGLRPRHAGYLRAVMKQIHDGGVPDIHFAGANAESASFLGLFKVFVMISRNQGCPNASLEAMAAGLPVVANATGGTAEQVRHGATGFLVGDDDPAEMAARVAELLENPRRAQAMGEAGREHARAHFSMGQMVASYRGVLSPQTAAD
jgi:glycosyltransferase involved in cell wall biosynthesis